MAIAYPMNKAAVRKKVLDDAAMSAGLKPTNASLGGALGAIDPATGASVGGVRVLDANSLGGALGTINAPSITQPTVYNTTNQQQGNANIPGQAQTENPFVPANTPPLDIAGLYGGIGNLLKGASDAGLASVKQQLYGQIPAINQQYDALNTQAYTNARLSALGSNEALAAMGLAGNAYAAPQSGVSETSRIAQDVALRNALNANELARANALRGIESQIGQATSEAAAALLGQQANLLGQQAQATIQESQFGRSLAEQQAAREQAARQWLEEFRYRQGRDATEDEFRMAELTGEIYGQQTLNARQLALQEALAEAGLTGMYKGQQTLEARQQAIENAMNKVNLIGYVDEESSKILGLPVGTPSWQANAWKQEFDLMKRRSSGGGSKGLSDADLLKAIMDSLGGTGTVSTTTATGGTAKNYEAIAARLGMNWNAMPDYAKASFKAAVDSGQIK